MGSYIDLHARVMRLNGAHAVSMPMNFYAQSFPAARISMEYFRGFARFTIRFLNARAGRVSKAEVVE